MSTFDLPPTSSLTPAQVETVVRERCERFGLDYDKVRPELNSGSTLVRVALWGEEGNWPASHIESARAEYLVRKHITTLPTGARYRVDPAGPVLEILKHGPEKSYVRAAGSDDPIGSSVNTRIDPTHKSVNVLPVANVAPANTTWIFYLPDEDRSTGWTNHGYVLQRVCEGVGETPDEAWADAVARGRVPDAPEPFADPGGLVAIRENDERLMA